MLFFKLIDGRGGKYIGEIRVPEEWALEIKRRESIMFTMIDPSPIDEIRPTTRATRRIHIVRTRDDFGRDGVMLVGIDPEEFCDFEECWFYPTIDYLRAAIAMKDDSAARK